MSDAAQNNRLDFPATGRNQNVLLETLTPFLNGITRVDGMTRVLEIASGSGQHAAHFATRLPSVTWQPSDPDPAHRASIHEWTGEMDNVLSPMDLDTVRDAAAPPSELHGVDVVLCCNMIHIAPWAAGLGLLSLAGQIIDPGGFLFLYGPFKLDGQHTSESNARFDESLQNRDPAWGVRDLDHVTDAAEAQGLALETTISMPANNLSVIFRRQE